jgi:hypothetical protein
MLNIGNLYLYKWKSNGETRNKIRRQITNEEPEENVVHDSLRVHACEYAVGA